MSTASATLMNTYWDIVVDWGLLGWNSKNFLLRDKLLVPQKTLYFVAMVRWNLFLELYMYVYI